MLEAELQLQLVLVGLLSVMYNAAQSTDVYKGNAVTAVTTIFYLLQFVAFMHIGMSVGYDLVLQLHRVIRDLLQHQSQAAAAAHSKLPAALARPSFDTDPQPAHDGAEPGGLLARFPVWSLMYAFCCPCLLTRERAKALFKNEAQAQVSVSGRDAGTAPGENLPGTSPSSRYLFNPLGSVTHEPANSSRQSSSSRAPAGAGRVPVLNVSNDRRARIAHAGLVEAAAM